MKRHHTTMTAVGQASRQPQDIRCLEDLAGQLNVELIGGLKGFVPANRIEAFSSREVIVRVLANKNVPHPEQLAEQILHHQAKRLFLLTAKCNKVEWLYRWLDDWLADWLKPSSLKQPHLNPSFPKPSQPGLFWFQHPSLKPFGDRHLPVEVCYGKNSQAPYSIDSIAGQPGTRSWVTGNWEDSNAMTSFATHQWSLLAPVFTEAKFHYELHDGVPLPFLTKDKTEANGAFSDMYEVRLHWAHQEVITPKRPGEHLKVALKAMNRTENKWFTIEMRNLEAIRDIEHTHLIRPIASYKQGRDCKGCFLFPWADKGNLKAFWKRRENQKGVVPLQGYRAHKLMIWTLSQMLGLCSALAEMHKPRPSQRHANGKMVHCRHGDIKPENILVFDQGESEVLCLADIGLGKFHEKATDDRKAGNIYTDTKTGTTRYLPPEFGSRDQIPRIHDIWSLGCLFLEFIIWAAWGNDGLDKFIQLDIGEFWQRKNNAYQVHESVEQWVAQMRVIFELDNHDTVFSEMLEMVSSRMLVLEERRKSSENIRDKLKRIFKKAQKNPGYYLNTALCKKIQRYGPPEGKQVQNEAREEYKPFELGKLKDEWRTHTHNKFAWNLRNLPRGGNNSPNNHGWLVEAPSSPNPVLCTQCGTVDLWQADLRIEREVQELIDSSDTCGLCRLIRQSLDEIKLLERSGTVSLRRNGPTLETMPDKHPVLSIYADPASGNVDDQLFQIGVPILPTAGSREQFALFKEWLRVCGGKHKHVTTTPMTDDTRSDDLPTRVIEVGSSHVRLINGKDMASAEYIALSHCWGSKLEHYLGRTLRDNYISRYNEIDPGELPRNFQDAIKITRGLDLQYLWIDSICIIQEDPEDWSRESMRMEQVYSNAKCVLAASSSTSSIEGFLERPAASRPFIAFRSRSGDVGYICKNIDNFRGDVDEGILNTRGWTLQERALARRTIHFTKNQAYFECSDGIQCESLTRLTNGRSSMLGDSDFPTSVVSRYKDGRVVLIQTLYHQYSKRDFSQLPDRPITISGLEKRLTPAFNTRGGYGVFQYFLERTLLWKRDDDSSSLKPIKFPPTRNVPTWSWMAYDGVISYVQADFDKVDWTKEYSSPFDSGSGAHGKWHWEADGTNRPPILGLPKVRELDLKHGSKLFERITFDTPDPEQHARDLRCVVIGKAKPDGSVDLFNLNCYVLIVKASSDENLRGAYFRVGAGELMGREIIWDRYEAGNLH